MAGETPGRRTKFRQDIIDSIILSVSIGASYLDAARAARISDQTLTNWLTEGRKARETLDQGGKLDAGAKAKLAFLEEVEQAEAQCAVDMQVTVYNAAQKDTAAAQWWLERRRPDQFRPVVRNENSGLGGGPMEIVIKYADSNTHPA